MNRRGPAQTCGVALLVITSLASARDTAPDPVITPRIVAPTRVFDYSSEVAIKSIHLAPDGDIVAHLDVAAVNLWSLLVSAWPEMATTLIALALLLALRRAGRRPQVPGEPHCRKCNYTLTGATGERCPECGLRLGRRGRVVGRSRWKRVTAWLAALLLLALLYGTGRDHAPRRGTVCTWLTWPSTALYDWASRTDRRRLTRRAVWSTRIVRIDPATGEITRTILDERGLCSIMRLSGDARHFVLARDNALDSAVTLHDLETGGRTARLPLEPMALVDDIETTADGRVVLIALNTGGSILEWEPARDRVEVIATTLVLPHRIISPAIALQRLEPSGHIGIAERWNKRYGYRVWDPQTRAVVRAFEGTTPDGADPLVSSLDGERVFLTEPGRSEIVVLASENGAVTETIASPGRPLHVVTTRGGRLYGSVYRMTQALYVCDLETGRWPIVLRRAGTSPPMTSHGLLFPDEETVILAGSSSRQRKNAWSLMVFEVE